jgi:acylphosphatase
MERICQRLLVTGRVQGVFFRDWTVAQARDLGLGGWVRNLADGAVEIVAAGPDEAVAALVERCRRGPERARVDHVSVADARDEGWTGFDRRPDG